MKYFEKIPGGRIYLSPICKDDSEIYTKWINDAGVSDNLGVTWRNLGIEKETEVLESLINSGYHFSIILREGNELIGNAGLLDIHEVNRCAQIGIFIGEKRNRGKGYGSEAMNILLKYGFETLNLKNIMLRVFPFNEKAVACYKKLGFKEIGARRSAYFLHGRYYDEIYMDILAEEFASR